MRELDIEKIEEKDWIKPEDGYQHGYYGYTPDETDADSDTVAVQGPLNDEMYKSKDKPEDAVKSRRGRRPGSSSKPADKPAEDENKAEEEGK